MVAASSSSSEDDISLGASQEAAPTPPAMSTDVVSSNAIFGMKHKKKQKKPREIGVSKAGTTWRFGGISNRYTSRKIYGRTILST